MRRNNFKFKRTRKLWCNSRSNLYTSWSSICR